MGVVDSIREMLTGKSSVQMVADDPHMAAEILLLVRMMFADGQLTDGELERFKKICETTFEIPSDDVPEVVQFLRDFGYETSGEQAAGLFADLPQERKQILLQHLLSIARADHFVHEKEGALIAKIAGVLGFTPEQVRAAL